LTLFTKHWFGEPILRIIRLTSYTPRIYKATNSRMRKCIFICRSNKITIARLEVKEQRARESNTKEYRIQWRSRSSAVTLDSNGVEKQGWRAEDLCASKVGGEGAVSTWEAAFRLTLAGWSRARERSVEWIGGRCGRTIGVYIQFNKLVAPVPGPSV
jgi:hypothetical protein